MRLAHGVEHPAEGTTCGPQLDRARQIHAVSVVDPPEVQHHPIPGREDPGARPGVRQGAVGPGRHDGLERRFRETGAPQRQFDLERDLGLGPSRPNRRQGFERRRRQHPGRLPHDLDLAVVLDHPGALRRRARWSRSEPGSSACEPRESVEGHHGALDSDGGAFVRDHSRGDAILDRARRELDAEVAQPVRSRPRAPSRS